MAIGVISFLATIIFTGLDLFFPHISGTGIRKILVLTELGVSGLIDIFVVDENLTRQSFV